MKPTPQLHKKIMRVVVQIEKQKIRRWLLTIVLTLGGLVLLLFASSWLIRQVLAERQTLAPLTLFSEDWEIVRDYWREVFSTFWMELPLSYIGASLLFLAGICATLGILIKKRPELRFRQKQLAQYESREGKTMAAKREVHHNFTAFGIIGVVSVLALMAVYPKLVGKTEPTATTPKRPVTTENEFSSTGNSPKLITGASPEEKQAAEEYFFTIVSPVTHSTVNSKTITVSGKTVPNADVYVNEIDAKANAQGNFSVNYQLEEGINYLVVGGNDTYGNYQEQELVVTYEE